MRVLVLTNMYPDAERPHFGIFVKEQVESLRDQGIDVDVLFVDGQRSRLNYFLGFPRLWGAILRRRYDLIHAHYVFSGLIARSQFLVPVVLTHHGPEVFMTWQQWPSRLTCRLISSIIVVSQEMKERLRCSKARVIPCGIDLSVFHPLDQVECRTKLGISVDRKVVLWAGDRRPEKRYELVEAAFKRLETQRGDVQLVSLSGKPHELVAEYINAADVLVLTSDAEGSPMVIKEALACNRSLVATNVGDVAERIHGLTGCFITSQEPADIAENIQAALEYEGRPVSRSAVTPLSLEATAGRIIEVYRETLGDSRVPTTIGSPGG